MIMSRIIFEDDGKEISILAHDKNVVTVSFRGKNYNVFAIEDQPK